MKIRDIMIPAPGQTTADATLRDASATMTAHRLDAIPVLEQGIVVGVLSQSSLLAAIADEGLLGAMHPVRSAMDAEFTSYTLDDETPEVSEALAASQSHVHSYAPVIDEAGHLIGVVALGVPRPAPGTATVRAEAPDAAPPAAQFDGKPFAADDDLDEQSFPASDPIAQPSSLSPGAVE